MDATSRQFVQGFRRDNDNFEPDLAVDGLTDSLASRLLRLIGLGKS